MERNDKLECMSCLWINSERESTLDVVESMSLRLDSASTLSSAKCDNEMYCNDLRIVVRTQGDLIIFCKMQYIPINNTIECIS